jgi:hypothetical protein
MADSGDLIRGLPGLVRVASTVSWKVFSWTVSSSVNVGTEIVKRTINGEPPAQVLQEVSAELRAAALEALGFKEEPARLNGNPADEDLRAIGESLLRRSADVTVTEEEHPAYARILSELTPDEARILRFLYLNGPQPAIDVRTNRPLGIGSELISGGLNMIAEHAGCRHVERIHPYLTNLNRLGLIEFSKEQVENPNRYQLVEAQPKVAEVLKRAGRAPKIVRRSIHLNAFGEGFVLTCLPTNGFPGGMAH